MTTTPTRPDKTAQHFDENAQHIAGRQYLQQGDGDISGMFWRIADWVAGAEQPEARQKWAQRYYDLMAEKKFCPGGRVLAGAGTQHGNVLNCFVQGSTEHDPSSFEGVMEVAKKLALVTKVGGGNGVNLDVYTPRAASSRSDNGVRGWVYMSATHPDVQDFIEGMMRPPTQPDGEKQPVAVRNWTRVVYGQAISPELVASARSNGVQIVRTLPEGVQAVPDDMGGIVDAARMVAENAKVGLEPRIDLSQMREEGAPIKGSGGTSSGPVSFLLEIFDNFLEWANRGAEQSGPINTLRYVYAPVLRVVRQGGCLHPDTLVHTDRGTLRLRELVDVNAFGHYPHALSVATDEGWKHSPEGFNNGHADTLKVTLDSGLSLQGTPNHKVKVLRENGEREWVRFDELQAGDWAIQSLDGHTGTPVLLQPLPAQHFNAKEIRTPDTLTEDFAFWLGYLWGDGFVSETRVGFAVAHGSPMAQEGRRLFRDLFGLELREEQKENDRSSVLVTRSAALVNWLELNGLLKGKALTLDVPRAVRQAPRPVLGAFLRGLFEADGTLTHGYPQLSTASEAFAQDVAVLLGGLGIPTKLTRYEALENRYSEREHYRLHVVSSKGLERYRKRVGWLSGSRFEALATFRPDEARESSWPLPHAAALLTGVHESLPAGRKGAPSEFTGTRKTLSRYLRGERSLTATGYAALSTNTQVADTLPAFDYDEFYSQVREVTPAGRSLTLDICVDENHTYIAGGLVTHNTRRGAGMATISIGHPDILDFLTAKDLDREAAEGDISTFNISILVDTQFWDTLQAGGLWDIPAQEVAGKYYLAPQTGDFDGTLPQLPTREEDGAKGVPVYAGGIPAAWLWDEIAQHAWSTGEPGLIFNDRVNEYSALKNLGKRYEIRSTNPCVTADTWVSTAFGARQVRDLIGKDFCATVNGQSFEARGGFWLTGVKPVLKVTTRRGYELRLTDNHRLLKVVRQTRDVQDTEWVETSDLAAGDRIMLNDHRSVKAWAGAGNFSEGWLLGSLIGDGTFLTDKARPMAALGFWGKGREELADAAQAMLSKLGAVKKLWRSNDEERRRIRLSSEALAELAAKYDIRHGNKTLTDKVEQAGYEFYRGVLQGLFDADGSVQGHQDKGVSVRLAQSDLGLLQRTQRMLARLGILSSVYAERRAAGTHHLPDGKGGSAEYSIKAQHELVISGSNLSRFAEVVGFRDSRKAALLGEKLAGYARELNRERFCDEIVSIVPDGEEAVYDVTVEQVHAFDANCVLSHNCGEIPLTVGEPCDLGAINLAAYVENSTFNFKLFRQDVRTCVRFLDDVLDVNVFALEDNRVASQDLRRLGLGVMGLADALIKMGLRYDNEAGRQAIYDIMSALREEAVAESERLGTERGIYPVYERHAEQIPHQPRRNVAVLTVAPTGCVVPDTLVSTARGMHPIANLGHTSGRQWQDIDLGVHTDEGVKRATKFFVNGVHPVRRVTTRRGFSMAATHNHQVRVIDRSGEYVWRRMDELQVGDQVVLKRHTLNDAPMTDLELAEIGVNGVSSVPSQMSEALAELLGLYMGDGYLKRTGGLHIVVSHEDPDLREYVSTQLKAVFQANTAPIENRVGCDIVTVNGRCISRFFNLNHFAKPSGNQGEGAEGAFIPDAVLASGARATRAFLRGLFEADGTVTPQGGVALSSVSLTLMRQAQAALLGLGIVAGLRQMPSSTGRFGTRPIFELRLLNRQEVARFRESVGFISGRKQAKLSQIQAGHAKGDLLTNAELRWEFYHASEGLPNEVRQGLRKRVASNAALSQPYVKALLTEHPQLADTRLGRLVQKDIFIDTVAALEDAVSETYDLSVPENVTYIANGFVSHNTTSMLMGVSSGIEPVFSPFIWRKIGSEYRALLAPLFVELLESYPAPQGMSKDGNGSDGETRPNWDWDKVTEAVSENHGSVVGLSFIPEAIQQVFVCAHDISPADHVRMQGTVQRAFDDGGQHAANSLSKTINLPNSATVQDVQDAYSEAYKTGCKGITVYRDGSRQFQVLSTSKKKAKKEEPTAPAEAGAQTPAAARQRPTYERPPRLAGTTDMIKLTDSGTGQRRTFLITVNQLNGQPVEVMVISGRAGDEPNADSEALGRVVSIALQHGVPPRAIIKTLRGINGGLFGSYNGRLVGSKADLIAVALETYQKDLGDISQEETPPPLSGGSGECANPSSGVSTDNLEREKCPMCGEKAVIREEGCHKCQACGYSKCG